MKMFFDATLLLTENGHDGYRSGIYFVAKNLLEQFVKCDKLQIFLFTQTATTSLLDDFRKKNYPNLSLSFEPNRRTNLFDILYKFYQRQHERFFRISLVRKCFTTMLIITEKLYPYVCFEKKNTLSGVYFSPNTVAPGYIRRNRKVKKYVVLHDLIPLRLPEYAGGAPWFWNLIHHLNVDDFYFANSDYTKKDFLNEYPFLIKEHIETVPLAASSFFKQITAVNMSKIKLKYNIPNDKKYIFSLCTVEPRKNLIRIMDSFVRFVRKNNVKDLVFVVGGGAWKVLVNTLKAKLGSKFENEVYYAGYIDDEDLPILYSNAEWFVYTSQYEGFGLPPLEAMQCGCPVIVSNSTSLPEVVGDAGILIDWDSDEQHVAAYEKYYYNEKLRNENRRKGLERATMFSWEKAAKKMISVMGV